MTDTDLWTYRDYESWQGNDISGFSVEAIDGEIGSVDQATYDVASSFLVVDTGPWIFGKKVMLPAGVIDRVDMNDHRVFVHRTKDEIKNAPEFDEAKYRDETYRAGLGTYYGRGGAGYREWNS
ncbi:MAG TPA: PRC-barrel domain-containing protein [Candidatus Limnocylindria bacterium]|nr:PRC-barrel domain-containing protein [Candidatus Limnocylindria bacterium]